MANPSKAKGTAMENCVLAAFKTLYVHAERRAQQGKNDKGDLYLPGEDRYVVEVKNVSRFNLPEWIREAQQEAKNAGVPVGIVVSKRRGSADPLRQYVHMELGDFLTLVCGGNGEPKT